MLNSFLETPEEEDSAIQMSSFRFRNPKTKKYMLHKMVTIQQKQAMNNLRRRQKKKDPDYFSRMVKQQKKKMFVNTFIKKLKNSIILSKPPPECKSSSEQIQQQQQQSIQISKKVQVSISIFLFLQVTPLLISNSLSLVFQQVFVSDFLKYYNIFSCLVHLLQMAMKLMVRHNTQQKKKKYLIENIHSYIYSQDLYIDSLVLLAFFVLITFHLSGNHGLLVEICHLILMFKIKTLVMMLDHIELVLIENQYREQIWNLLKVILFNFVIGHCLAIILIAMAGLDVESNWIQEKGLSNALWYQQYIWGYYWAVTIMLTVGFGDITPTTHQQAFCMIFVQTMSCIVLAYNINRVGSIISKIRSYDIEKNSNLKVFQQISQKSQIDSEIQDKITNYIKESTIIKRNSNIQEEKGFISKLPQSFREELLKEMNKNIWNGMIFFRNISEKTLHQLSKHLQKKLTHPQQIVYTRGHQVDVMIFNNGTFGLAYNNGNSFSNGKIIQKYLVKKNQFRIASLEFLLDNPLNYDIKCIDYMIFYKVKLKMLFEVLENCLYDYEYFFMIKEKDKFILNQFQIEKCHICQNQRHTMFKCPRLHYIPLKQHVIEKHCRGMKTRHLQNMTSQILKRHKIRAIDSLKQMKYVKNEMRKIRLEINHFESDSEHSEDELITGHPNDTVFSQVITPPTDGMLSSKQQRSILQLAFDQVKQGLEFKHKQYRGQTPNGVWQLQCDLAHNFKFYFKQFNSEDLHLKNLKKRFKSLTAS